MNKKVLEESKGQETTVLHTLSRSYVERNNPGFQQTLRCPTLVCRACVRQIRAVIYCEGLKWMHHLQLHTWNTSTLL